jgi:hypothetical protein
VSSRVRDQGEKQKFMPNLSKTVNELRSERTRLARELDQLDQAISVLSGLGKGGGGRRGGKRRLSAAARKRIADAQKARWAKWKAKQQKRAA